MQPAHVAVVLGQNASSEEPHRAYTPGRGRTTSPAAPSGQTGNNRKIRVARGSSSQLKAENRPSDMGEELFFPANEMLNQLVEDFPVFRGKQFGQGLQQF